jgi:hypothetical protein
MFSIFAIPFFPKDVGPKTPNISTSSFFAVKAFANDFILVQGAPEMGFGSSRKKVILSGLSIISHSKFRYYSLK